MLWLGFGARGRFAQHLTEGRPPATGRGCPAPVESTSHRAVRSSSASPVLPGGRLGVTISPTEYVSLG